MTTTDITITNFRLQTAWDADTQKLIDNTNRISDIENQIAALTKTIERLRGLPSVEYVTQQGDKRTSGFVVGYANALG